MKLTLIAARLRHQHAFTESGLQARPPISVFLSNSLHCPFGCGVGVRPELVLAPDRPRLSRINDSLNCSKLNRLRFLAGIWSA
jgi:hypothetical protein